MAKKSKNKTENKEKKIHNVLLREFYFRYRLQNWIINMMSVLSAGLQISISWVMRYAINSISDKKPMGEFLITIGTAFLILLLISGINYGVERMKNSFVYNFNVYVRKKIFERMLDKDIIEYEKYNTGEYLSVFQMDIIRLSASYIRGRWSLIQSAAICVMGVASMVVMSLKMSVIILAIQSIPVGITVLLGIKMPYFEQQISETSAEFASETQDYLKGFRIIKGFSAERIFTEKFMEYNKRASNAYKLLGNKTIGISLVSMIANYGMLIGLFLIGGIESINGKMQIGTVIACSELLTSVSGPFSSISEQINEVKKSRAIFERMDKLFFQTGRKKKNAQKFKRLGKVDRIDIQDLSFSYTGEKLALKHINISFEDGKKYAVVGNSGSGKSTLLKLMLGYYEEYSGKIMFNDLELKNIGSGQLNKSISIVQQDVFVFNDTVLSNITLNVKFRQEDIDYAIQNSGLSAFMKDHGEDYNCGEGGKNLSGGEKQRISIARALLKRSGVIFFDEATSALDNITSLEIEQTINSLDSLCIVITHKLNLDVLKKYDEILVFDHGVVAEKGTADELMAKKGAFYKLYTHANKKKQTAVKPAVKQKL